MSTPKTTRTLTIWVGLYLIASLLVLGCRWGREQASAPEVQLLSVPLPAQSMDTGEASTPPQDSILPTQAKYQSNPSYVLEMSQDSSSPEQVRADWVGPQQVENTAAVQVTAEIHHSQAVQPRSMAPPPIDMPDTGQGNIMGEHLPLMFFEHHGVNPFVDADEDPESTFSLDGDVASYDLTPALPCKTMFCRPPEAVRTEEFVNRFTSGFPAFRRWPGTAHGHVPCPLCRT